MRKISSSFFFFGVIQLALLSFSACTSQTTQATHGNEGYGGGAGVGGGLGGGRGH